MVDLFKPPTHWLAVIVLYKIPPAESNAFRSLLVSTGGLHFEQGEVKVLLYDNTPGGSDPGLLPQGVRYEAAKQNAGLAVAYNRALAIAQRENCTWLLILDQDTMLPSDYLSRIFRITSEVGPDEKIAAIVPRMLDKGRSVSPVFMQSWGTSYSAGDLEGTARREIHATNSATLFRVSGLQKIGGFSPYFWLDYLDGYVFHQLYVHGLKVYIARDIQVEHRLSLLHGGQLTPDRFHNIVRAESAFWDLYGTPVQRLAFAVRLLGRIWRQKKRGHNSAIRQLTWNELCRRVFRSRESRINEWKRAMERKMMNLSQPEKRGELFEYHPRVSVCMAAYNGEPYIEAQLMSILSQLETHDEIIVVDDASTDETRNRVRSLNDRRIRLIEHNKNQGILRTFEDAIRAASGEILFLSDQDDLWEPTKISTVLRAFQLHLEADVAVSNAALINEGGSPLGSFYYAERGRFRSGLLANIFRCSYLGCTMAIRSRIREKILPFPVKADVLHDLWIGAVNSLTGGKTVYIDDPLVQYRRHENNITGNRRLTLTRRVKMRWDLCRSLAAFWADSRNGSGNETA